MYSNTKQIEVKGETYTLTVRRSIVYTIARICPELVKIWKDKDNDTSSLEDEDFEKQLSFSEQLYDNMDILFYEMIKIAHPDITKEKSNQIYYDFLDEYNDVDKNLFKLIEEVFTGSVPREKKKNLNW